MRYCFSRALAILVGLAMVLAALPVEGAVRRYTTNLEGGGEGSGSLGTGFAHLDYDDIAHTMTLDVNFQGLGSPTTVSHIHAPTVDPFTGNASVATTVPTFPGFPAGVTAGSYNMTFDLTLAESWNSSFVTGNGGTPATAETAFFGFLSDGRGYLNIHTEQFPSGEIRGYFQLVPEPTAAVLFALAGLSFIAVRRVRRGCA